jgi:predicted nucleic acid-binding protein
VSRRPIGAGLRVYADATALIGLSRIGHLDLLALLPGPTCVTARVRAEVIAHPDKPGVTACLEARTKGLLAVVEEGDPDAFPQLDPGEATVISAAAMARAIVLADERKARALIDTDPHLRRTIPRVVGIIGLILLAKRQGHLLAVRPLLDELIRQSFWVGPAFYREVLRQAGEL